MAKAVKYRGQFRSRKNVLYEVYILVEGFSGYTKQLTFAGSPISIKWKDAKKHDPIVSSECTLNVISTSDREFIDLYTMTPGSVAINIYKESEDVKGELNMYWQGLMDTEFYSEPYNMQRNYQLSFTFSDFGILNRIPYDRQGKMSVRSIINAAKSVMQNTEPIGDNYVNIKKLVGQMPADALDNTFINSANFYDEDGEAMTWMDTLTAVLQPLGLKVTQRDGCFTIYDIDGLYLSQYKEPIKWAQSDQKLGVDNVYNNIRITFSTYCNDKSLKSAELSGGTSGMTKKGECTYPFASTDKYAYFNYYEGSKSKLAPEPDSITDTNSGRWNSAFAIVSHGSGENCAGVRATSCFYENVGTPSVGFYFTGHRPHRGYSAHTTGYASAKAQSEISEAFYTKPVHVMPSNLGEALIRIELPMLIDLRYNPFEEATQIVNKDKIEDANKKTALCLIPVRVMLIGDDGKRYHYHQDYGAFTRSTSTIYAPVLGRWVEDNKVDEKYGSMGDGSIKFKSNTVKSDCWLAYYDASGGEENPAIGGWKTNRHNVGLSFNGMTDKNGRTYTHGKSLSSRDDGEYIPAPPVGGMLQICVYNTFFCYAPEDLKSQTAPELGKVPQSSTWAASDPVWFAKGFYDIVNWHLFKTPTVKWLNASDLGEVEQDDIERSGLITTDAKEELHISTKCGTLNKGNPTSQACFVTAEGIQMASGDNENGYELFQHDLGDNVLTAAPEVLLISSLYSQYAERHQTIDCTIEDDNLWLGVHTYYDASTQPVQDRDPNPAARVYMELSRSENLSDDTAKVTLCEISPSTYTPIQ